MLGCLVVRIGGVDWHKFTPIYRHDWQEPLARRGIELCKCHDLIYVIQESYPGPRTPDLLPLLRESHQELTTLIIDRSKSLAKFDTAEE